MKFTRKQDYCFVKFTRKQDYLGCKDTKNIVSRKIMSRYFARNGGKKAISRRIVIGRSFLLVVEMCGKTMDFHD